VGRVNPANAAAFRDALARFASGVTVVTARGADGTDHGMTVSAFASLSLDPPLVLACIETAATALPAVRAAEWFGVSILAADQQAVSARFATHGVARFDGIATVRSAEGPALIAGAVAHLVCRRVAEHPGGDHVIIVGEVHQARVVGDAPLLYALRGYGRFRPTDDR
jgi:flavin reductase (DIM6/NTAB) family NADH-FMN oxidoreductase RutF